jgi:hypothetical protein
MRTLHSLPAFIALLSALSSTGATASPDTSMRTTAQQRTDLEGIYGLSNGQRVRIFELDYRLYLQIGRLRKEILLVAPYRLASRDGRVTLWYTPYGSRNRIILAYPAQTE